MSRLGFSAARYQIGISFVEVLVAMVIGVIILAGVMQSMLTNQRNTAWSDDVAYVQENARYALETLARDIRWAGYWGCAVNMSVAGEGATTFANSLNVPSDDEWLKLEGLRGYEGGVDTFPDSLFGGATLWQDNSNFVGNAVFVPDAVIFRGADDDLDLTVVSHAPNSAQFKLSRYNPLEVGDLALVVSEDCKDVGLMQMTGPSSGGTNIEFVHNEGGKVSPGNCTKAIRHTESFICGEEPKTGLPYGPGSFLMRFAAVGYFIGTSAADDTQPALYRVRFSGMSDDEVAVRTDEIAVGVEDMQLLYGVDTEGDGLANVYVRADEIDSAAEEWKQVVSVRVTLLLRGFGDTREGEGDVEFVAYPFAGENDDYKGQAFNDRVLRQQVSKTVHIRNVGAG
jgi:type IV pilus assembly protein PilW